MNDDDDVCSMQDMAHLYPDRVITIRGGLDNLVQAEAAISVKLAECMNRDAQAGNMVGSHTCSRLIDVAGGGKIKGREARLRIRLGQDNI